MKTPIIFIVIVVVMAGLAYFTVSTFLAPEPKPGDMAEAADSAGVQDGEGTEKGEIYMVKELLVNPTGTSGTRYLSANLGLEVSNPETVTKLEEQDLQIRDLLITILSSRTVDQLTDAAERERMRTEIAERLNTLMAPAQITAVYFVDYVLQ